MNSSRLSAQFVSAALSLALLLPAHAAAAVMARVPSSAFSVSAAPAASALRVSAAAAPAGQASLASAAPAQSALPLSAQAAAAAPAGALASGMSVAEALLAAELGQERVKLDSFFDAAKAAEAGAETAASAPAPASHGEGAPPEAAALHKAYEVKAKERMDAWQAEVDAVQSGRFGLIIQWQMSGDGRLAYGIGFKLDGKPNSEESLDALAASGAIPAAEWAQAKNELKAAAKGLLKKLVATLQENEKEHVAVHEKMDQISRQAARQGMLERRAKGQALEAWGLPDSVALGRKTALRYGRLYKLDGSPTELGAQLHDMIAPLMAADPAFVSKLTVEQLEDAVQHLYDSLKYTTNLEEIAKKARMMGMPMEGYDYPEARNALLQLAKQALTRAPEKDERPGGFAARPESERASLVMQKIYMENNQALNELMSSGSPEQAALRPHVEVMRALHSALGMPIPTGQGVIPVPVQHKSLLPVLAQLKRVNASEQVVGSVIRSFPMGESLWRMGVHKLWERGITGKGVKVAVLDNGVDFDHPDFEGVKSLSENMTRDRGVHTKGGHGTPMASILHAIAPDAEIQSYQVLSNTSMLPGVALGQEEVIDAILKAMDRAVENGASILSMSLSGPMAYARDRLSVKIAELAQKGVLVVASAGNSGQQLPKGWQVGSPATAPDAISVGAVDYDGKIAGFSSEGVVFDPSEGTARELPIIYAYGVNVKSASRMPKPMYLQDPLPYEPGSGTSPAAPHVSGVLALALQAARDAGVVVENQLVIAAAKQALAAGAERIARLPVLKHAERVIESFKAALATTPPAV